ncbi:hypothetical protein ACEPPN_008520 [Leptodophora sp. 'Broadleaf-Isolate-01']
MGKQKQIGKNKTKTESKSPVLLALPPEIRNHIWKLVFETGIIHLFSLSYSNTAVVKSLGASLLKTSRMLGVCSNFHHDHQPRQSIFAINGSSGPGPLSWLRTNRQIYNEAKSFVQGNLSFHFCNTLVFDAFLSQQQKAIFSLSTCQSLSLCLKIRIESDYRDGFSFARDRNAHGWDGLHSRYASRRALVDEAKNLLPVLRELKLHIFFVCKQAQGPRLGQVYRQKDPAKLFCVDNPRKVEAFINRFCDVRPLNILRMAKLDAVSVQFETDAMEHYTVPSVDDRCWCIGRTVDESSLLKIKLGERIEERLMNLSKKESGADDL